MAIEIFIPHYGRFDYLKQAVESVLSQSDPNWSLTVVDDGYPTDEAANYFERLSDKRISYIKNPKNLGVTGNFNRCIELAKSDHMVILGFDDRLKPNFIEAAEKLLRFAPTASIYQLGVEVINGEGMKYQPLADRIKRIIRPKADSPTVLSSKKSLESLLVGNWLYFPSIIWKTEELKKYGFDSRFTIVQDLDLISKILLADRQIALWDEPAFEYRRHPASLSSLAGGDAHRYEEEMKLFAQLQPQLKSKGYLLASKRAKRRITSRLAALVDLLRLLASGKLAHVGKLIKVIVS